MEYLYTDRFKKILSCAEDEKIDLNHPYVGTEHLLLSFLKNSDKGFIKKLNVNGLDYDSFKDMIIKYIGVGHKNNNYKLYTPLLRHIVDNAFKFSDNNFIDEDNLFLSFYFSEDGIAKSILKVMNIDLFKILKM